MSTMDARYVFQHLSTMDDAMRRVRLTTYVSNEKSIDHLIEPRQMKNNAYLAPATDLLWRVVDAGTEVLISEHATESEANAARQRLQIGDFPVYRVQKR